MRRRLIICGISPPELQQAILRHIIISAHADDSVSLGARKARSPTWPSQTETGAFERASEKASRRHLWPLCHVAPPQQQQPAPAPAPAPTRAPAREPISLARDWPPSRPSSNASGAKLALDGNKDNGGGGGALSKKRRGGGGGGGDTNVIIIIM